VLIGVSAWYRDDFNKAKDGDMADHNKAKELINELTKKGFMCKMLHEKAECFYEAASVAYAYARVRGIPGHPAEGAMPGAYLAGGSKSSQFAHSMSRFVSINRGNKNCFNEMYNCWKETGDFDEAFKIVGIFANGTSDCELIEHLNEQQAETAEQLTSDEERQEFAKLCVGEVICISACYYAGLEVGLGNKKSDMQSHPTHEVVTRMQKKS
jgi:hypothetical protein